VYGGGIQQLGALQVVHAVGQLPVEAEDEAAAGGEGGIAEQAGTPGGALGSPLGSNDMMTSCQ
jgi:hypothetical protein